MLLSLVQVVIYSAVYLQLQGNGKDLLKNLSPIQSQHEPVASLPSCLCPGDGKGADPRRAAASCPGGTAGGSLSIPCTARRAMEELGLGCAQGPLRGVNDSRSPTAHTAGFCSSIRTPLEFLEVLSSCPSPLSYLQETPVPKAPRRSLSGIHFLPKPIFTFSI